MTVRMNLVGGFRSGLLAGVMGLVLGLGGCKDDGSSGGLVDRGSCDALIACASGLAPEVRDEYEAAYGQDGTCWAGGPMQWALCRDTCQQALDGLNAVGQITGETCGTCEADQDCEALLGAEARCEAGSCVGGMPGTGSTGDTGETGETGDTDTDTDTDGPECTTPLFEAPDECLTWVECSAALNPDQAAATAAQFGPTGTCWCGSQADAQSCLDTCEAALATAQAQAPGEPACQPGSCPLAELDPTQPYGPVVDGACPDWDGAPQVPTSFDGIPGGFCAPACQGISQACPSHAQSVANGRCLASSELCAMFCYVDNATVFPGTTQCPCGAGCQPLGQTDDLGNALGVCTFE